MTETELKERFNERQRNRRLEDFGDDAFDDLIEIDDPFAIFKNAERPDSDDGDDDDDDKADDKALSMKERMSKILGKRPR